MIDATIKKKANFTKYIRYILAILIIYGIIIFAYKSWRFLDDNSAYLAGMTETGHFISPSYPVKFEHYMIEVVALVESNFDIQRGFITKKIIEWTKILAYKSAARKLPENDPLLKFLKYKSMVSIYMATDANAWKIYDEALQDIKLLSEDKMDFASNDDNTRLIARALYANQIILNLSDIEFIKTLKRTSPTRYQYFYKFFDEPLHGPQIYKYQSPSVCKEYEYSANIAIQSAYTTLMMNKCFVDLSDKSMSCNSGQGDDLVKQFNMHIADTKKFIENGASSDPQAEHYRYKLISSVYKLTAKMLNMCPCRARELMSLNNSH
ncbi:MAG: hypothetical protein K0R73_552 [Candidatus Midichloriaceae bacterium]|jgi:hypothetical protein|nr:hypothetical protein [Candidatus Midichloriaceae bacterium]